MLNCNTYVCVLFVVITATYPAAYAGQLQQVLPAQALVPTSQQTKEGK